MLSQKEILSAIKTLVKEEIPDAKVYLFGSRATGKVHDESDWDILVLTNQKVDWYLEKKVWEKLSNLSILIYDIIDCTIVNETEWEESPSYYVLRRSIKREVILV